MHFVFALLLLVIATFPARAEQWAAQAAYAGGVGPVVHAATEEEARAGAVTACQALELGNTCSRNPAASAVGDARMFVATCCKSAGATCIVVPVVEDEDAGRKKAYRRALEAFVDAKVSIENCWRHSVYSVRTGKRLRD